MISSSDASLVPIDRMNEDSDALRGYGGHGLRFLVRVALLYYVDGLTQHEISAHLGISRQKVARMLARARESGIVRISVSGPLVEEVEIANQLLSVSPLVEALIVPTVDDPALMRESAGRVAADYLESLQLDGKTIAVSSGRTVYQAVKYVDRSFVQNATVVSLIGGFLEKSEINPNDIAAALAERLSARCLYVNAMAMVDSKEIRDAIMADSTTQSVLTTAKDADIALVGIGTADAHAALLRASISDGDRILRSLDDGGAVGQMIGRYFDSNGRAVNTDLDSRIIGVGLEDLRQMSTVIAVACGKEKSEAIAAGVRGHWFHVLITDVDTARDVISRLSTDTNQS